jgi:DNA-directed RNA polymerase subunit RPC12/RpoP
MPLPVLESPKYEVKLPATGKKVAYRPFLVKEEKILMIAMESQDQNQILTAMKDVVKACTFGKVNPDDLTMFELEYLFLKLRSKSVGEMAKLSFKCEKCGKPTPVEINLDTVEVDMTNLPEKKIKLTDKIGMVLRWPKVDVILEMATKTPEEQKKMAFDMIAACIESIYDDKKIYPAEDQTTDELVAFIESLNQPQFLKVQAFIEKMPKLAHTVNYECSHCKEKNTFKIEGLQNFFSSASLTTAS